MINKTERYYVVSESELVHLKSAAWGHGFSLGADHGDVDEQQAYKVEAEAACRVRPVPEWAEYFIAETEYVPKWGAHIIRKKERIKK